ncbi:hypothetical protein EC991_007022 [Linnemannia zychae]|nr:hypothetical protein EC991_007022 [Linnemannia zychae]
MGAAINHHALNPDLRTQTDEPFLAPIQITEQIMYSIQDTQHARNTNQSQGGANANGTTSPSSSLANIKDKNHVAADEGADNAADNLDGETDRQPDVQG